MRIMEMCCYIHSHSKCQNSIIARILHICRASQSIKSHTRVQKVANFTPFIFGAKWKISDAKFTTKLTHINETLQTSPCIIKSSTPREPTSEAFFPCLHTWVAVANWNSIPTHISARFTTVMAFQHTKSCTILSHNESHPRAFLSAIFSHHTNPSNCLCFSLDSQAQDIAPLPGKRPWKVSISRPWKGFSATPKWEKQLPNPREVFQHLLHFSFIHR